MKGIKTLQDVAQALNERLRSDHCPAMKGIKTHNPVCHPLDLSTRSDHCPAMKGIKTYVGTTSERILRLEATTAPQ